MRWSSNEKGKHGYHALSVTGQNDEYDYLRNPWGTGDQGATDSAKTVAREVLRPPHRARVQAPSVYTGRAMARTIIDLPPTDHYPLARVETSG